ncbi:hypothetical protein CcaverHIS002_0110780 [Cutaneotrichosporon cavernicola]|uniref:WD40 repeat-like protein n=1 Tax=Cutaneotrichosporon cavernicola TaxID=279322 RepID=A0AA48I774_9TREE|nr:uncharacterized protein CcaverHIS019_0110680 [Cutaneotrichosporon cavernicola]BEI80549.1 hypothetical protein CcaverHIS002_0110780 [Cutaneotrichosporon cavernicola]BEI88350.1 hypothetical protein CcaverHIS019_0110680 [Cutaneotrichosporon cavernicola]BEI96123.1 hypothetical protein CcaverHIS631_0110720 [Cutaneotrichosporon cavernicola]BEJ03895.1 hypothetical protein CcaverHIS641_0110700 [Cutaneotrichosporon cavernicola]
MDAQPTWSAPAYDFAAARPVASTDAGPSFFRSARWTTDGTAILTAGEDRLLSVHDLTHEESGVVGLAQPRTFPQPDSVNAAQWYPSASRLVPETFCFVASVRDAPVRLIDASDGRIRASYPIVDHRERFIAPYSFAFNTAADKLYCGFENAIEVFDIASPGYDTGERLKLGLTRKEKGGQRGIISALAFSAHHPTFAAGSFAGSVVLYDEDTRSAIAHVEGVEGGGVIQIAFHPLDPNVFFVASRRSEAIQPFDLRDTSAPVGRLARSGSTNQRLAFDVDPWGRWLASGDEFGTMRVWDIGSTYDVLFEQKLHGDAVNSVQFHAHQPLLLTCAGSRAHLQASDIEFSSNEDTDSDSDSDDDDVVEQSTVHVKTGAKDSRLAVWSFGQQ